MNITMKLTITTALTSALLGLTALPATAQQGQPFRADEFDYGSRFRLPDGQQPEIWNPAKRKLLEGGPMIGGTVRATDPRTYCAMAAAGYDFVWVEMQHEAISWEQVARFWRTCPGPAAPGARVAYADERAAWFAWLGPLRELSLGLLLMSIVLALYTIGTVLSFQFNRMRDIVTTGD